MRHLFDQYSQPENRLTHALVSGLAKDKKLLRDFIFKITGKRFPRNEKLNIVEQNLPGEIEFDENIAEEKGLPDAWIYTDDGWSLIIESKVAATISSSQLKRHLKIAMRRGFPKANLLVLATKENIKRRLPENIRGLTWAELYEWLSKQAKKSTWAKEIKSYLQVAEARMVQEEYLKEGTLTKFSGIPFNHENPFNYFEAKRVLRLLIEELKKRKNLLTLGVDPTIPGRGAIRWNYEGSVWDFLSFKPAKNAKSFTLYPHLTVGIDVDKAAAYIPLTNSVIPEIRKRIFGSGKEKFNEMIYSLYENMEKVRKFDPAIKPVAGISQRHWPVRSKPSVMDAKLQYDLRTAFKSRKSTMQKYQPEWLDVTYKAMTNKRSNMEFYLSVEIPYGKSKIIDTPKAVELFEMSFLAYKPFIKMAFGK